MRSAAKELEFERAAALRDEIQQIRLRVLEQDQSVIVGEAAERAARGGGPEQRPASGRRAAGADRPGRSRSRASRSCRPTRSRPRTSTASPAIDENTAADWLPGIRDEHDDDVRAGRRAGSIGRRGTGP